MGGHKLNQQDLSDREREVLEAVVRAYVETAEPAGSRALSRRFDLGVSPATIRNTMSDLEAKGYLAHPHTSAGRVPTDSAYRFYVDRVVQPRILSAKEKANVERHILSKDSGIERILERAARALGVLVNELGVGVVPQLEHAVLEKLDLIHVSMAKVLMVATVRSGLVRTLYVDLPGGVPADTLVTLAALLNERLAGLTFAQIHRTIGARLRDSSVDEAATEVLNIFIESSGAVFGSTGAAPGSSVVLGQASVLASQPEFSSGEQLKELLQLTEQRDLLAEVLGNRAGSRGLSVTIGSEHLTDELTGFTLVTSEYEVGGLKGVIGVMGPTRMPYEKVIAIVSHTSSLITRMLQP